jgi:hypothetical protein
MKNIYCENCGTQLSFRFGSKLYMDACDCILPNNWPDDYPSRRNTYAIGFSCWPKRRVIV